MNAYTENTHELVKILYLEDIMAMEEKAFRKLLKKQSAGRFQLIVVEPYEMND